MLFVEFMNKHEVSDIINDSTHVENDEMKT